MTLDMRVKYDIALRRKAADLFGRGLGYRAVSTELEIPKRTAKGWLRRFRATGAERLLDVGAAVQIQLRDQAGRREGGCRGGGHEVRGDVNLNLNLPRFR